jgi:hypothetical protein
MPLKLHEGVCGSGGIAPLILNMGARWRLMISFSSWMHYSRRGLLYLLNKRLVEPQSQDGPLAAESFVPMQGFELQILRPSALLLYRLI